MALAKEIDPKDIQRDIENDIAKGIIAHLYSVFGDTCTYYLEDVPQGFKTPSFAVTCLNPIYTNKMKDRQYWQLFFDVLYFCDSKKPRQEWNTVKQKLAIELKRINACNTSLKGEIQPPNYDSEQQVGHFYVGYGMHVAEVYEESTKMEVLEMENQHVGGKCNKEGCPIDWR